MRHVCFHFDPSAPASRAWFDQLPERLAGHAVVLDHRPEAADGRTGDPWLALLTARGAPGRWACAQVLARRHTDPVDQVAAEVSARLGTGQPLAPAVGGPLPAVVWDGRRFDGADGLDRLAAAWLTPAA